jgi:hypothetical protein
MAILLDTNAYLRLAKHFNPLLGSAYVIPPETLEVLSEVDTEISSSPRLENKFFWAFETEYKSNRTKNLIKLNGNQPTQIKTAKSVIDGVSKQYMLSGNYKSRKLTPPSPTDNLVLAYSTALNLKVVSDDGGMKFLATELGIELIGSHELLKIMFDAGKIKISDIQAAARYLNYIGDMPASWKSKAKTLFGVSLP